MFPTSSLLTAVLVALSVSASPLTIRESSPSVNLPFALNLNLSGYKLPELDRARASYLIHQDKQMNQDPDASPQTEQRQRRQSSFEVTNTAITYVASVDVGSPATSYTLLIDTGSSNTWIGANKPYSKTSTSKDTGKQVDVSYGSGKMTGEEYTDTVALSSSLVIDQQSIGVASSAEGFSNVDGIIGLGPADLTSGSITGGSKIPTITDNLYTQKKITTEVIGISFNPTTSNSAKNGELSFGDLDNSKYTGDITYAPITNSWPAKRYWGYDQSITYGSSGSSILSSTAGILDTGTTLVLLATDAYNRYKELAGANNDDATGLLMISKEQFEKLESLYFTVGGTTFELTANAQIFPPSLNSYIGGSSENIYLIINDLGNDSGSGLDFINGYTFLERFYSVFDTTNNRVGLANTVNTKATTN